MIFKILIWHSNWVGKSYFDIQNLILTFKLSQKSYFLCGGVYYFHVVCPPIRPSVRPYVRLILELSRKMLFWHSKSYFDIRTESENRIFTFEILFWQSNRVGKSYFDIQNPILTFKLSRKSYFLWGGVYCFHVVRPPIRPYVRP